MRYRHRRARGPALTAAVLMILLLRVPLTGQPAAPPAGPPLPDADAFTDEDIVPRLKFNNATLEIVLDDYGEKTGRTLLMAPGLPKVTITLQSQGDLTMGEYLNAIEAVLSMNQIALLEVGEKFLKVVPSKSARQESMAIVPPAVTMLESDRLVSQMIPLKHIVITEAQAAVDALKHPYATVQMFERINSILITDTASNINRIVEILSYLDQPAEIREEPHVVPILHAKADDIKRKLEEIIADAQQEQQVKKSTVPPVKKAGAPGVAAPRSGVPGVIRPPRSGAPAPESRASELVEMAERGVIRGKVKIISDERTNILIIITPPENMRFFEKIIRVLDVATDPDVIVRIVRLEYADAETVGTTLNTLIGKSDSSDAPATAGTAKPGEKRGAALKDYVEAVSAGGVREGKSMIGELSADSIKILSDKRTNSILIMASKADFAAIEELIKSMDIMLSQVFIEVVIFKIGLTEQYERGIDWVQRALVAYDDAGGARDPSVGFSGAAGGETDRKRMVNPLLATSLTDLTGASGNLSYYLTFFNLNLDAIIRLVASDGRSEIVASPVILTTDNKEASINVTKEKYFFKGLKFVSTSGSGGGEWVDDVTMRKIGTKLTVTPRINEKKFVVMEITQSFEEEGASQRISGSGGPADWPTVDASELTASVAVRSGETIVLGGLTSTSGTKDKDRVPLIGDIPLIGRLFQWVSDDDRRDEIVVFITPYVLDTPEEIDVESRRRREAIASEKPWPTGSSSRMVELDRQRAEDRKRRETAPAGESWWEKRRQRREREALAAKARALREAEEDAAMGDVDPEMLRFIKKQDARWDPQLERIDAAVESDLRDAAPE